MREVSTMKEKKIYVYINIIILIISVFFVLIRFSVFENIQIGLGGSIVYLFPMILTGFVIVHFFKMMRIYIILMEQNINYLRFIKIYTKITFVNITLPFKIGELFRIYCFGKETKNSKIGVLSVIIDRFFDICALLIILIPYDIVVNKSVSSVTFLLVIFAIIALFLYRVFLPTYVYLNRYLITNGNTKNTINVLKILDNSKVWYEYIKKLLKGRSSLVFILSCLGWVAEFFVLMCIKIVVNESFGIGGFVNYINSIFGFGNARLLNTYTSFSCIVLAFITFIIYGYFYFRKKGA